MRRFERLFTPNFADMGLLCLIEPAALQREVFETSTPLSTFEMKLPAGISIRRIHQGR
jgi:hypothetical protein